MRRRAKRTAVVFLLGAIGASAVVLYYGREQLLIEWYLLRLRSGDTPARLHAARRLGEHSASGAVPVLSKLARDDEELTLVCAESLSTAGPEGLRALAELIREASWGRRRILERRLQRAPSPDSVKVIAVVRAIPDDASLPAENLLFATLCDTLERAFRESPAEATATVLELYRSASSRQAVALAAAARNGTRRLGPDMPVEAVRALADAALDAQHIEVRSQGVGLLAYVPIEDALHRAALALEDGSPTVRAEVTRLAVRLHEDGQRREPNRYLPLLLDALTDENDLVAQRAASAIGTISPDSFSKLSESDSPRVLRNVLEGGPRSYPRAALSGRILERLAESDLSIEDPEQYFELFSAALKTVVGWATVGRWSWKPAVSGLRGLIDHPSERVSHRALEALAAFGPRAVSAIPALVRIVARPENGIGTRQRAIAAIAAAREAARKAVPVLLDALEEEDLCAVACDALASIGPAGFDALATRASSPDLIRQRAAFEAIGQLGGRARPMIPRLVVALSDRSAETRYLATRALDAMWRDDPHTASLDLILPLLGDEDPTVRRLAAEILARGDENTRQQALPELATLARDRRLADLDRVRAIRTLVPIANPEPLIELLEDERSMVRLASIEALGEMGAAAQGAIPRLVALRGDDDASIVEAANAAIDRIQSADGS